MGLIRPFLSTGSCPNASKSKSVSLAVGRSVLAK
jgi:hypothetical protein